MAHEYFKDAELFETFMKYATDQGMKMEVLADFLSELKRKCPEFNLHQELSNSLSEWDI